jgi:hypothetical protein
MLGFSSRAEEVRSTPSRIMLDLCTSPMVGSWLSAAAACLRLHLGFLEGKPSTLAPWGPVIGDEQVKARKPGFDGFRFFHWEGQSNHEKSLQ